ncbi:SanA/YdcF family protein [Rhodococcus globerulus]|uniref:SanA/YdcF family protein n=1 Tax=Rhodococcus globerulus TaxID=33008 RepID=UPI000AAA2882|nr:ElyC/SanA/YdcF family protein [Rhodococcus globerulus]
MKRWIAGLVALGVVAYVGSVVWISVAAKGHTFDVADAPEAPVVIVLGAQIKDGKPMAFLKGRLDAAVQLVEYGKASAVLVSGDANGASGDEIAAMTNYLVEQGIDERRIVGDPYGLDTYDSCSRVIHTYGVSKALIVTQGYHVPRAVALCRDAGIDADGVNSDCGCATTTLVKNAAREWILAKPKAAIDMLSGRDAKVTSPPEDSVNSAVRLY